MVAPLFFKKYYLHSCSELVTITQRVWWLILWEGANRWGACEPGIYQAVIFRVWPQALIWFFVFPLLEVLSNEQ